MLLLLGLSCCHHRAACRSRESVRVVPPRRGRACVPAARRSGGRARPRVLAVQKNTECRMKVLINHGRDPYSDTGAMNSRVPTTPYYLL